nr:hypothetical protein [Chitinophagaceae bacterium]
KLLYGKDTIHIVQTVLNEADKGAENQIFAVELLDNILEPVLKEMIIPIFEPIPQQMRWAKLSQQFYIYHLSIEERLKEILLKNFKLINVQIKLEALNNYYQLTNDETILQAFTASHVEELNNQAQQLNNAYFEGLGLAKQNIIEQLQLNGYFKQDLITLFSRYGILVENTTKQATTNNVGFGKKAFEHVIQLVNSKKQKIDVDIVGLGVLFKLKYANMQE